MSTALTTTQPKASALAIMAARFSVEPNKLLETLKNTVFKNANESQLLALVVVANEYGLNPFTKQIYAFPDKGGGIVPVVSVDGWIKLMNDQPRFDGIEFETTEKDGKPVACTATIYVKDRSRPVKVTEYYSECHRNTDPWNKSPMRMIRHKALIQCVRVAFGLSGINDEDDAEFVAMKPAIGRVVAPPVKTTPALADAKQAAKTAHREPEPESREESNPSNAAEPEPEQQQESTPEATETEGDEAPPEIPSDPTELLAMAKDTITRADLEESDVVRAMKKMKRCGAATKNISDFARSGLVYLVENVLDVVKWLNENPE